MNRASSPDTTLMSNASRAGVGNERVVPPTPHGGPRFQGEPGTYAGGPWVESTTAWVAALFAVLPNEGQVILTKRDLARLLGHGVPSLQPESPPPVPKKELTVKDIAEREGRSPSTVREWIREGKLRAYMFHGKEWRVRPEDYEAFKAKARSLGGWTEERRRLRDLGP